MGGSGRDAAFARVAGAALTGAVAVRGVTVAEAVAVTGTALAVTGTPSR